MRQKSINTHLAMSSFQSVMNREMAHNVMREAIVAANNAVPDVNDENDSLLWNRVYENIIKAESEEIQALCHMLKRRNNKRSMN